MRNYIIILLAVSLVFFGCLDSTETVEEIPEPEEEPEPECTESDSGLNKNVKGSVVANGITYDDVCESEGTLREYFCSGTEVSSNLVDCGEGFECSQGACVESEEEEVEEPDCVETDSGRDYTTSGTLTYKWSDYVDTCQGNYDMIEYYCEDDKMKQENHHCDVGQRCVDGACIVLDASCTDSDSSNELELGTTIQYGGGMVIGSSTDSCVDAASRTEYYCEDGMAKSRVEPCPLDYYCEGGACHMLCFDADLGKEFDEPSYVRSDEGIFNDYCVDEETVMEYYCSDDNRMSIEKQCNLYCYEGECIESDEVHCDDSYSGEVRLYYGSNLLDSATDTCLDYRTMRDYICITDAIEYVNDRCEDDEICYEGSCRRIYEPTCFDLDDQEEDNGIYVKSSVIKTTNNSILEIRHDECLTDYSVKEYMCDGDSFRVEFIDCPDDEECRNGVCTYTRTCEDSDGGKSLSPGFVSIYDGGSLVTKEEDGCASDTSVYELYCTEDGRIAHTTLPCPEGLTCDSVDGSCK